MKKMGNFLALNSGWILMAFVCGILTIYAITKLQKPIPEIPTTSSANFAEDEIYGNPVMRDNPHANVFNDAAQATIYDGVNPWVYLKEHWSLAGVNKDGVRGALLDFITNEARQRIPDSSDVSLSLRDYSNPNSIVMEYRDPKTDSILVTTGHDPEPALYATFTGKNEAKTFKLICANGLVREIGKGDITSFEEDYIVKEGESFIGITGATPLQAYEFGLKNNLSVRAIFHGRIYSKTPDVTRKRVYANWLKGGGLFDVVLQTGDILRKKDGKWLYVRITQKEINQK